MGKIKRKWEIIIRWMERRREKKDVEGKKSIWKIGKI